MTQEQHDSISGVGLWLVPVERSVCVCVCWGVEQDQEGVGRMVFFLPLSVEYGLQGTS